jgi:hypothetical protein
MKCWIINRTSSNLSRLRHVSCTCLIAVRTALKIERISVSRNMSQIKFTVATGILFTSSYTNQDMERRSVLKPICSK